MFVSRDNRIRMKPGNTTFLNVLHMFIREICNDKLPCSNRDKARHRSRKCVNMLSGIYDYNL
jgi:hypothetical protein